MKNLGEYAYIQGGVMQKRILFIVVVICACAFNLSALVGVKGGLARYKTTSESINFSLEGKNKYFIGAFLNLPFGSNLTLRPEVLLVEKGGQKDILGKKFELDLKYLEIPVLLRYHFIDKLGSDFGISFGPYYALRRSADFREEEGDKTVLLNMKNITESYDYGLCGGVFIGILNLDLELRFTYGLKNIYKLNKSIKNKGVSLALSFSII